MFSLRFKNSLKTPCYNQLLKRYFKSRYSLDKIYPKSTLDFSQAFEPPKNTNEKFCGFIPHEDLKITFSSCYERVIDKSAMGYLKGPYESKPLNSKSFATNIATGEKEVVPTKCTMQFNIDSVNWIPEAVKKRIKELHPTKLTAEGDFVLTSEKTRTQFLNVADCFDMLRCIIREASRPPPSSIYENLEMYKEKINREASVKLRVPRKLES